MLLLAIPDRQVTTGRVTSTARDDVRRRVHAGQPVDVVGRVPIGHRLGIGGVRDTRARLRSCEGRCIGSVHELAPLVQQAADIDRQGEHREQTRHLYLVRTDGLQVVREFLDGFWPTHLSALKDAAEAEATSRTTDG